MSRDHNPAFPLDLTEALERHLGVTPDELPATAVWMGAGNTLGSLALRLGILSLEQVEQVIDLQVIEGSMFGELAVKLEYLSIEQRDGLLVLQRIHRHLDFGSRLVFDGRIELSGLLTALAELAE